MMAVFTLDQNRSFSPGKKLKAQNFKQDYLKTTQFEPGSDLDEGAEALAKAQKVSHRFKKYQRHTNQSDTYLPRIS